METIGSQLCDFSQPFDITLLDQVIAAQNDPSNPQRNIANEILMTLQQHQESWTKVCEMLEKSQNTYTHFFALQVSEGCVAIPSPPN